MTPLRIMLAAVTLAAPTASLASAGRTVVNFDFAWRHHPVWGCALCRRTGPSVYFTRHSCGKKAKATGSHVAERRLAKASSADDRRRIAHEAAFRAGADLSRFREFHGISPPGTAHSASVGDAHQDT